MMNVRDEASSKEVVSSRKEKWTELVQKQPVLISTQGDTAKMMKYETFECVNHIYKVEADGTKKYKHTRITHEKHRSTLEKRDIYLFKKKSLMDSIQSEVDKLDLSRGIDKEGIMAFADKGAFSNREKRRRATTLQIALQKEQSKILYGDPDIQEEAEKEKEKEKADEKTDEEKAQVEAEKAKAERLSLMEEKKTLIGMYENNFLSLSKSLKKCRPKKKKVDIKYPRYRITNHEIAAY